MRLAMPMSSPHSLPGKPNSVLDVDRAGGVVRAVLFGHVEAAHVARGRCRGRRTSPSTPRPSARTTRRASAGGMKNSISICSNSRVRKMKLPGVISLRNALPTWPMPNGGFLRDGGEHVREVHEDALRRLGAQVVQARLVVDDAEVGLHRGPRTPSARCTGPSCRSSGTARRRGRSRPCGPCAPRSPR